MQDGREVKFVNFDVTGGGAHDDRTRSVVRSHSALLRHRRTDKLDPTTAARKATFRVVRAKKETSRAKAKRATTSGDTSTQEEPTPSSIKTTEPEHFRHGKGKSAARLDDNTGSRLKRRRRIGVGNSGLTALVRHKSTSSSVSSGSSRTNAYPVLQFALTAKFPTPAPFHSDLMILYPSIYDVLSELDFDSPQLARLVKDGFTGPSYSAISQSDAGNDDKNDESDESDLDQDNDDVPDVGRASGRSAIVPRTTPILSANKTQDSLLLKFSQIVDTLDVSYWTSVPIPNSLAVDVIKFYLCTHHPIQGWLDAELFVRDLVTRGTRFCSRLMQTYTARYPDAGTYIDLFLSEAFKLWKQMTNHNAMSITCALFLENGCTLNGLYRETGWEIFEVGCRTAESLAATHNSGALTSQEMTEEDHDMFRAECQAVWGFFTWNMYVITRRVDIKADMKDSLRSATIGGIIMNTPSKVPIPYEGRLQSGPWAADREFFAAVCQFRKITARTQDLFRRRQPTGTAEASPVRLTYELYRQLLSWAAVLPELDIRLGSDSHLTLTLRIWFHSTVVMSFRPFLGQRIKLDKFMNEASPEGIFSASLEQLKYQILCYRKLVWCDPVGSTAMCELWGFGVVLLGELMIRAGPAELSAPFFVRLCIYASKDIFQFRNSVGSVLRGLIVAAGRGGLIDVDLVRSMMDSLWELQKPYESTLLDLRDTQLIDQHMAREIQIIYDIID